MDYNCPIVYKENKKRLPHSFCKGQDTKMQSVLSFLLLIIVGIVYCAPQWPGGCAGIGGGGGCSQPCAGFGCLGPQPLPPTPCGGASCPISTPCGRSGCPMIAQPIQQLTQQAPWMGYQTSQMTGGCNPCYRSGMPGVCCPYGGIGYMGSYGTVGGGGIGGMGTQLLGK